MNVENVIWKYEKNILPPVYLKPENAELNRSVVKALVMLKYG